MVAIRENRSRVEEAKIPGAPPVNTSKGKGFSEAMERADEKKSSKTNKDSDSQVSRSHQKRTRPSVGNSKGITITQARRLASVAPYIREAAKTYNVPVELICGVILQESGGNTKAKSHCGAQGLMQLMPGTARRFGVTNSYDPRQNIHGGTKYLRFLMDKFKGNIELTLAGYNAGEHNVAKHGNKVPPFAETRAYIPNVLGYTQSLIDILSTMTNSNKVPGFARRA